MLITESIYELLHFTIFLRLFSFFYHLNHIGIQWCFMRGGRVRELSASLVDGFRKLLNSNREDFGSTIQS
jgi:hypothetical protein